MKKFEFEFETILELRKIKVDEELKKLSIIVGHLNRLQNEVTDNTRIIQNSTARYSGSDIKTLRLFEGYMKGLYLQNENLLKAMQKQQGALDEARQRVIEVERDAEVMEILKKDAWKEYHDRLLKQERIEEEEIANSEYFRRRMESEDKPKTTIVKIKKKIKKTKPDPNKVKTEYEKLMEYAESLKPKK